MLISILLILTFIWFVGFLGVFIDQIIEMKNYDRANNINRKDGRNEETWFLMLLYFFIACIWPLLALDKMRHK